ncbi:MAG: 4-hydroxybenzoate octaprenyltransferase [Albidovulum sp.]|nr:4-hydroxybenzoate octaprenyltransferase [Albidovulum sp.]
MPQVDRLNNRRSSQDGRVADSVERNWVDSLAPAPTRPLLRLSRADRPIGTWLLLLPCWWGLSLAGLADSNGFRPSDLWIAAACAAGAFLMRGAGCTWNDLTDRDLDAQVERTKSRPLPSGQIGAKAAYAWMATQALLAFLILITFNEFAIYLGIASLIPVAIYPFAKRFTWWPQFFLGIAFNWGALLAWAAHSGSLGLPAILLYLSGIAWTLYYDTIYAHQDKEDDAMIGIKSTALLFGEKTRIWLYIFIAASCALMAGALLAAAGFNASPGKWIFGFAGIALYGACMVGQARNLDLDSSHSCLRQFRRNRDIGIIPAIGFAMASVA